MTVLHTDEIIFFMVYSTVRHKLTENHKNMYNFICDKYWQRAACCEGINNSDLREGFPKEIMIKETYKRLKVLSSTR